MSVEKAARLCSSCQTTVPGMSKCARCRVPYYCSAACQRADWPAHKSTCRRDAAQLPSTRGVGIYVGPDVHHRDLAAFRHLLTASMSAAARQRLNLAPTDPLPLLCAICGDSAEECPLMRSNGIIICRDCVRIQLSM